MSIVLRVFFSLSIILIVLSACNNESTRDESLNGKKLKLSSDKGVKISLFDKASSFFVLSQEETINQNEYLIFSNPFPTDPNLLFFSSVGNKVESFALDFEVEGPNGVGQMSEFYFHNFDSIFVFNRYSYSLSLVDSSGKVKRRFLLRESEGSKPNENTALTWVSNKSKVFKIGNYLYIPTFPDKDPFFDGYLKENLLLQLDLNSGESKQILGYPTKYKSGGYWGGPDHILPSVAMTNDSNLLIVSYPIEDSIFLYDISKNKLKAKAFGKSNIVNNVNPKTTYTNDRIERLNYQLGTDYYFSIIFDPYRNQYYRFASQKYSDDAISDIISKKTGASNKNSLLKFDSEFNLMEEFDLPIDSNGYLFFVFKSGVYIVSKNENEEVLQLYYIDNF